MGRQVNGFRGEVVSAGAAAEPVFVLCMARSGSTLLRFLLDAHPELACPPETSLPALCGQLAVVWSLIEGAPLALNRGDAPPQVPDAAIAGIRRMVDEMTGGYLARRGKQRFCDKSLGSAATAGLLLRIYPGAKFICVYRHPMDMIRSGLDACPWGLNGYGFEQYAGSSAGNSVLALARYWLDNATLIAAFEEQHPDRCHRVRYEDLVAAPEEVAAGVFEFLGVAPAPGITRRCFTGDRERRGPADYKIWATSAVTGDSVGRGESVPVGLIPPQLLIGINGVTEKLRYLPVDEKWGSPGRSADQRVPATAVTPAAPLTAGGPAAVAEEESEAERLLAEAERLLEENLRTRLAGIDERFAARWPSSMGEKFLAMCRTPADGGSEAAWLVDLAARTVAPDEEQSDVQWTVLGSPQAWQSVLSGQLNLHVALRRNDLRYCSTAPDTDSQLATDARVAMLSDLLGLSSWQHADADLITAER